MLACRTPFSLWIWLKRGTGKASTEQTRRSGKSMSGKNREKTGNGITDSASDYVRFYSHFSFLRSLLLVPLFTVFRYDTKKMRLGPPVHTWTTVNGLQIWNLKEFIFCFSTPSWLRKVLFTFFISALPAACPPFHCFPLWHKENAFRASSPHVNDRKRSPDLKLERIYILFQYTIMGRS